MNILGQVHRKDRVLCVYLAQEVPARLAGSRHSTGRQAGSLSMFSKDTLRFGLLVDLHIPAASLLAAVSLRLVKPPHLSAWLEVGFYSTYPIRGHCLVPESPGRPGATARPASQCQSRQRGCLSGDQPEWRRAHGLRISGGEGGGGSTGWLTVCCSRSAEGPSQPPSPPVTLQVALLSALPTSR